MSKMRAFVTINGKIKEWNGGDPKDPKSFITPPEFKSWLRRLLSKRRLIGG